MKIFNSIKFRLAVYFALGFFIFGALFVWGFNSYLRYSVANRPIIGNELIEEKLEHAEDQEEKIYILKQFDKRFRLSKEALEAIKATEEAHLDRVLEASLRSLVPFALLSFGVGYLVANKMLSPINDVILAASSIDLDSLDQHIPETGQDDELGQLVSTWNIMLKRLGDSNRVRDQFAQDASHELKTPLAVIRTNLEVLGSDKDANIDEYKMASKVVLNAVDTLNTLAEDLLLLTRRAHKEAFGAVDLAKILTNIDAEMSAKLSSKNIDSHLQLQVKKAEVTGNEFLLTRVLRNLYDNAVKYSDVDTEIHVTLNKSGSDFEIRIEDQGMGISESEHDNIFKRFYRIDKSRNKDAGGSGLGLAIVKEIVESHGGQVSVESTGEQGSAFVVSLPSSNNPSK